MRCALFSHPTEPRSLAKLLCSGGRCLQRLTPALLQITNSGITDGQNFFSSLSFDQLRKGRKLGHGASAEVFEATHVASGERCALKTYCIADAAKRHQLHAELKALLNCPHCGDLAWVYPADFPWVCRCAHMCGPENLPGEKNASRITAPAVCCSRPFFYQVCMAAAPVDGVTASH